MKSLYYLSEASFSHIYFSNSYFNDRLLVSGMILHLKPYKMYTILGCADMTFEM